MKEEQLENKFTEMLEVLNEGIEEPAGRGCGFGFDNNSQRQAYAIFLDVTSTKLERFGSIDSRLFLL